MIAHAGKDQLRTTARDRVSTLNEFEKLTGHEVSVTSADPRRCDHF